MKSDSRVLVCSEVRAKRAGNRQAEQSRTPEFLVLFRMCFQKDSFLSNCWVEFNLLQ